jgi:hypothetical protein
MFNRPENLEWALAADFDTYMKWCFDYCHNRASDDPNMAAMLGDGNTVAMLQALWAKRYWFNKCGVQP